MKTFLGFVRDNKGADCNLLLSQLLFWLVGFPVVLEHGWSSENYDKNGGIPSGTMGSGAFVVTLFFAVLSFVLWAGYMVAYFMKPEMNDDEEEED